jgi:hypothetical protein
MCSGARLLLNLLSFFSVLRYNTYTYAIKMPKGQGRYHLTRENDTKFVRHFKYFVHGNHEHIIL